MKKLIIQINELEYSYPGFQERILNKFSQDVYQGEILGVVGKNGVGKSTLMRLIAGINQPFSGDITINGTQSLDFKNRRDYFLNFVYLSHDKTIQGDLTLQEYCDIHSCLYPNYSKNTEVQLTKYFELNPKFKISALSTGNRMKSFLLFALSSRVPLILIDEVTAVLDPENREYFFETIKQYADAGVTFVMATNIVEDLEGFADRVWIIDKGNLTQSNSHNIRDHFKKKVA